MKRSHCLKEDIQPPITEASMSALRRSPGHNSKSSMEHQSLILKMRKTRCKSKSGLAQGPQTGWWPSHQATHLALPIQSSLLLLLPVPQAHSSARPRGCLNRPLSLDFAGRARLWTGGNKAHASEPFKIEVWAPSSGLQEHFPGSSNFPNKRVKGPAGEYAGARGAPHPTSTSSK